uniref:Uncharacterized protein n=1 Tax=Anguilla anguilla TaxID=7936 RepID=A0A0E9RWP5_ANGAN
MYNPADIAYAGLVGLPRHGRASETQWWSLMIARPSGMTTLGTKGLRGTEHEHVEHGASGIGLGQAIYGAEWLWSGRTSCHQDKLHHPHAIDGTAVQ